MINLAINDQILKVSFEILKIGYLEYLAKRT